MYNVYCLKTPLASEITEKSQVKKRNKKFGPNQAYQWQSRQYVKDHLLYSRVIRWPTWCWVVCPAVLCRRCAWPPAQSPRWPPYRPPSPRCSGTSGPWQKETCRIASEQGKLLSWHILPPALTIQQSTSNIHSVISSAILISYGLTHFHPSLSFHSRLSNLNRILFSSYCLHLR